MKRISLVILFILSTLRFSAQNLEDGYYRVSNLGSGRYVYVTDNTGSLIIQAATAEMGALELWKDHSKTFSNPASIIYIEYKGTSTGGTYYDLKSQGTCVFDIINYYVYAEYSKGTYEVYAEGTYLTDSNSGSGDEGRMGTKGNNSYARWNVSKVNNTDEYFGIKPSLNVQGRYFHPFFADFGFSVLGEGMKVWLVKEVNKDAVVITPFNGTVVPARTPVIIECKSDVASNNKLNLVYDYSELGQTNKLAGVYFNNAKRAVAFNSQDARTEFDKSSMRVLGVTSNGKLGYVLSKVDADEETGLQYLEANQSYLPVGSDMPEEIPIMTESEYEEWIASAVPTLYNGKRTVTVYMLSGRSLGSMRADELGTLPAGIYIIDSKKVVIK